MKLQDVAFSTITLGFLALAILLLLVVISMIWFKGFAGSMPEEAQQYVKLCKSYCDEVIAEAASYDKNAIPIDYFQQSTFCQKTFDLSKYDGLYADHCYHDVNDTTQLTNPSWDPKDIIKTLCRIRVKVEDKVNNRYCICNIQDDKSLLLACLGNSTELINEGYCVDYRTGGACS